MCARLPAGSAAPCVTLRDPYAVDELGARRAESWAACLGAPVCFLGGSPRCRAGTPAGRARVQVRGSLGADANRGHAFPVPGRAGPGSQGRAPAVSSLTAPAGCISDGRTQAGPEEGSMPQYEAWRWSFGKGFCCFVSLR